MPVGGPIAFQAMKQRPSSCISASSQHRLLVSLYYISFPVSSCSSLFLYFCGQRFSRLSNHTACALPLQRNTMPQTPKGDSIAKLADCQSCVILPQVPLLSTILFHEYRRLILCFYRQSQSGLHTLLFCSPVRAKQGRNTRTAHATNPFQASRPNCDNSKAICSQPRITW